MSVFIEKPLKKQNFIQRLFKIKPSENVLIELNNMLANTENITDLPIEKVIQIADTYNINLKKKFRKERLEMFRKTARYILSDNNISDEEAGELSHLRDLLLLNQPATKNILLEETQRRFGEHIDDALLDNRVSTTEKRKLSELKKNLLLDETVAQKIFAEKAKARLQSFIDDAISDERLSPEEETEIHNIAGNLGIDLSFDDDSQKALERFRLYWQIENGEIPEIFSDINLYKGEKLHFKTSADWIEHKQVTRRLNYAGPTARIKLAKGIYYRMGSLGVNKTTEDVWQRLDSGIVYLTDRRIIFMGSRGNKNIRLNKILTFNPFQNGVEIQKSAGKSPFLEFSDNVDLFSMILARLLFE